MGLKLPLDQYGHAGPDSTRVHYTMEIMSKLNVTQINCLREGLQYLYENTVIQQYKPVETYKQLWKIENWFYLWRPETIELIMYKFEVGFYNNSKNMLNVTVLEA